MFIFGQSLRVRRHGPLIVALFIDGAFVRAPMSTPLARRECATKRAALLATLLTNKTVGAGVPLRLRWVGLGDPELPRKISSVDKGHLQQGSGAILSSKVDQARNMAH